MRRAMRPAAQELLRPLVPSEFGQLFNRSPEKSGSACGSRRPMSTQSVNAPRPLSPVLVTAMATVPRPLNKNMNLFATMRGCAADLGSLRKQCERRKLPKLQGFKPRKDTASNFSDSAWEHAVENCVNEADFVPMAVFSNLRRGTA